MLTSMTRFMSSTAKEPNRSELASMSGSMSMQAMAMFLAVSRLSPVNIQTEQKIRRKHTEHNAQRDSERPV